MDWKLFAQLVVTFAVAALGWWAAHAFTSRRDIANERRKQTLSYLLEAYRKLDACAHRSGSDHWPTFASAIADIQLLGTARQISLVQQIARDITKGNGQDVSMDELLTDIRQSLRAELGLDAVKTELVYLRIPSSGES
jgi:hypothetical protein